MRLSSEPPTQHRCGSPSRWRWSEPCRRPSCQRCFARYAQRQIGKAEQTFGDIEASRLGWFAIKTTASPGAAVTKLRNVLDRERRRSWRWNDLQVCALFVGGASESNLAGFVYVADVPPSRFARVLQDAWGGGATEFERLPVDGAAAAHVRRFGARWLAAGPPGAINSFRSMPVTIGPRFVKRTRHSGWAAEGATYLEPMPVLFGGDDHLPWCGKGYL